MSGDWHLNNCVVAFIAAPVEQVWQALTDPQMTQAYFMGLLFLIAGYFVPDSFDRKGPARFLRDRAVRLGIPTLIYMLFINPSIEYLLLAFQWPEPRPHR